MPEPAASTGGELALCPSAALEESGRGVVFDVLLWRRPARAFALRFEGRVVAYLNRCAHVPTEMDWQPGEFLDGERRYIVCAMHGATYEPTTGRCIAGPCAGARLMKIDAFERDGQVYWRPTPDIGPAVIDNPAAPSPHP